MKLSELTPEQKTRLLAELDGKHHLVEINGKIYNCLPEQYPAEIIDYNRYDAIIPLVQKLFIEEVINNESFDEAIESLGSKIEYALGLSPSQLCDAVLVAAGKAEL